MTSRQTERNRLHGIIAMKDGRIKELNAEVKRLREALEWYGEQSRLARLIHSEGDQGRHNIAADGGHKARAALSRSTDKEDKECLR